MIVRLGLVAVLAVGPLLVPAAAAAQPAADDSAVTVTETITDRGLPADDANRTRDVRVTVSKTRDLANREQVAVELDGFRPTERPAERPIVPFYKVQVMQCRGAEPTPQTCAHPARSQYFAGRDAAVPAELATAVRGMNSPADTSPWPGNPAPEPDFGTPAYQAWADDDFAIRTAGLLRTLNLPFVAADGVSFLWDGQRRPDNGELWINEQTLKSSAPFDTIESTLNNRDIEIRPDGGNELLFEVRERASQPSLGCTAGSTCSLVVVPIMTMNCAEDAPPGCSAGPSTIPDAENFYNASVWMAPSNWENRLVVPLEFAPDPAFCGVGDPRPVVDLFGSELIDVAQQRWGAAYCDDARPADYLPGYGQGSEFEARQQFTTSIGPRYQQDAILTTQPVTDSPRPVVHAPSAVSGFTVAFTIDDGRGVQVQDITLSPRLLAKLITESYALDTYRLPEEDRRQRQQYTGQPITTQQQAQGYYVEHPTTAANPPSLFYDREFIALNPGIVYDNADGRAPHFLNSTGKSPVLFGVVSDVMLELTRYIVADPAARAWLDGTPDEYGMAVNPTWLRAQEFDRYAQRDTWVRPAAPLNPPGTEFDQRFGVIGGGNGCDVARRTPYYTRISTVLSSLETSALALLDRRGRATPNCAKSRIPGATPADPAVDDSGFTYTDVREPIQPFGQRAMLAVTSVSHANLYSLPMAQLVNADGRAVAPESGTMLAALGNAVQDPQTGTVRVDHANVRGDAYPGTMVTYTAAPAAGLEPDLAGDLADFMTFMATEGQRRDGGPADLPAGYDPLPPAMVQQATEAAEAVRTQSGAVPPPPPGGPLGGGTDGGGTGPGGTGPGGTGPGGSGPSAGPGGGGAGVTPASTTPAVGNGVIAADSTVAAGEQPADAGVRPVAATRGDESWLGRWGLLIVLLVGAVAAVAAGVLRLTSQPEALRAALQAVGLGHSRPRS